jgi:hypothetical protein
VTYTVHAKRWDRGWELHIDGFGVTQVKRLRDAAAMVADYIRLDTGTSPDLSEIEIIPEVQGVGGDIMDDVRAARRATEDAESAQREAADRSRKAVRELEDAGLARNEIAAVLSVSPQRVTQLLTPH